MEKAHNLAQNVKDFQQAKNFRRFAARSLQNKEGGLWLQIALMVADKLIISYIVSSDKEHSRICWCLSLWKNMPLYKKNDIWSLLPLIPKIFSVWTSLAARLELWTSFAHPLIIQKKSVEKGTHQIYEEYPAPHG